MQPASYPRVCDGATCRRLRSVPIWFKMLQDSPFDNRAPSEPVSSPQSPLCSSNNRTRRSAMKFGHLAGASLLLFAATACSDRAITLPSRRCPRPIGGELRQGRHHGSNGEHDGRVRWPELRRRSAIFCSAKRRRRVQSTHRPAHGPRFRWGVAQRAVADGREGRSHALRGEQGRRIPHVHQGREVWRRLRPRDQRPVASDARAGVPGGDTTSCRLAVRIRTTSFSPELRCTSAAFTLGCRPSFTGKADRKIDDRGAALHRSSAGASGPSSPVSIERSATDLSRAS